MNLQRVVRLLLAFSATALLSCASAGPRTVSSVSVVRLPLRFHLLSSSINPALTTTRTEQDVRELVRVANWEWKQAGIEWYVERVIREQSVPSAQFDSALAGTIPAYQADLISFVPRHELLSPGWNVFLIRDFGRIAGGMFRPEIEGVVLAERGFGFELPASGRGGATLAHELGHSLTLGHEPCDSTRNLMSNACSAPGVISALTPGQISRAREQALTGRPTLTLPSP